MTLYSREKKKGGGGGGEVINLIIIQNSCSLAITTLKEELGLFCGFFFLLVCMDFMSRITLQTLLG